MTLYLDIHSHQTALDTDSPTLLNVEAPFGRIESHPTCSIGLHPWHLDDVPAGMAALKTWASHPHVLAIGECGLDTMCETPMPKQIDAFEQQIALANHLQKPLIIHCVRAFAECIALLKQATVPVIFHGFQKHPAMAQELVDHGFYLSFGSALIPDKSNAHDSFLEAPLDRVFLETDNSGMSIREIYKAAAALRQMDEEELATRLQQNYMTVFKHDL